MCQERISSAELWKRVQETREREYRELEPDLMLFRASPEEIKARAERDAAESEEIERFKGLGREMSELSRFGSSLARSGREGVRFERWRQSRTIVK
jgi:hypothetical protein